MEFKSTETWNKKGVSLVVVVTVLMSGFSVSHFTSSYAVQARPAVFGGGSSSGPSNQSSSATPTAVIVSNYSVPSSGGDPIMPAKVTTFGVTGPYAVSVTSLSGVTPASVTLETGKLNQQFR